VAFKDEAARDEPPPDSVGLPISLLTDDDMAAAVAPARWLPELIGAEAPPVGVV